VESAGGKPNLVLTVVSDRFDFDGIAITTVDVFHADWTILGYRIGGMAYLTDCSGIPERSWDKLRGLDVLIISALRYKPHPAHLNVEQAVEVANKLKPRLTVLTHMGHELDYDTLSKELPESVVPAYDGMELELPGP